MQKNFRGTRKGALRPRLFYTAPPCRTNLQQTLQTAIKTAMGENLCFIIEYVKIYK